MIWKMYQSWNKWDPREINLCSIKPLFNIRTFKWHRYYVVLFNLNENDTILHILIFNCINSISVALLRVYNHTHCATTNWTRLAIFFLAIESTWREKEVKVWKIEFRTMCSVGCSTVRIFLQPVVVYHKVRHDSFGLFLIQRISLMITIKKSTYRK